MKRLAILFLLLATTMQAFVAQTHVHSGPVAPVAQVLSLADVAAGDEQLPTGGEHGSCLLCQIAAHGATAVASYRAEFPQAAQLHFIAALADAPGPHSLPPTHAWSSRGPPRS